MMMMMMMIRTLTSYETMQSTLDTLATAPLSVPRATIISDTAGTSTRLIMMVHVTKYKLQGQ
jgi:hypothetical protein